jgi:ACS family glucarate transporter-like MFS transporter
MGGKGAGTISGSMNMVGNLGAFLSSISFPYLYGWTGTATTYFVLAAILNVIGVFCWLAIKPVVAEATTVKSIASGG